MVDYEYEDDFLTDNEVREEADFEDAAFEDVESYETTVDEEVEEEDTGRVTEKPEQDEVDFVVHRAFTWHGQRLEPGEYTWPEDEYNAMSYDVNLRTDRQVFITEA